MLEDILKLKTELIKSFAAKAIEKAIKKKTGLDVDITINDLEISNFQNQDSTTTKKDKVILLNLNMSAKAHTEEVIEYAKSLCK